jgi:hypothetical protein
MQLFQETHPRSVNGAGPVQVQEPAGAAAPAAAPALPTAAAAAQGSLRLLPAAAQATSPPPAAQLGIRRGRSPVQAETPGQHAAQRPRTEQQTAPMSVFIKDLNGGSVALKVRPSTVLGDVLNAFCTHIGIGDSQRIRLIFAGRQLDVRTTMTVEGAGLQDGSMLHAMLRVAGG